MARATEQDRVRELQRALYRAAKADPKRRFHALYDKVHRRDVLERAWESVRANRGAAGIDRTTLADVERYGIDRLLGELVADLRDGRWRPLPARRVFIPKPGREELRPLSIPAVRDRIVQAALKAVIEPIFEADFLECSFGFRPKRSAHDALQVLIDEAWRGRRWVVETDIASCFDDAAPGVSGPASLLLVHGAGSGPWIFDGWPQDFPGVGVQAVDLHEDLAVAQATMDDYVLRVLRVAVELPAPLSICGWSMGGLVAMLAAGRLPHPPQSLVLIESSPPAEVQGFRPADVERGTFDPESAYGPFPVGVRARPESLLARAERQRGISVPSLPCPSLVIYSDDFPDDRGRQLAALYGSQVCAFYGLDHWDLVRDKRVRQAISRFHSRVARPEPGGGRASLSPADMSEVATAAGSIAKVER
jgi:pimeloyl-ACP methyl ester carboxylesterase